MTTLSDIGASLRNYRKKRGLTLSALAEQCHVHRNTLSALENGRGNVELNTLLAVCDKLGLELLPTPARVASIFREDSDRPSSGPTALQKRIAARLAAAGNPAAKFPK